MEPHGKSSNIIIAEIELTYRPKISMEDRPVVNSSTQAHQLFSSSWDDGRIQLQEQFKVLLLTSSNKVLGLYECSTGGLSGTVADVRLIFAAALKARATKIMLCHNHPNGELKPSMEDCRLTTRIKEAGCLLMISLLDHIIISAAGYFSFADEGLL
ncbi:RadC family protein [Mucilaginibacter sp. UC70_90]